MPVAGHRKFLIGQVGHRVVPMPEIPRVRLDALRDSTDKLNQVSDKAAAAVRDVEDALADCGYGSGVSIPIGTDPLDGDSLHLEYRKFNQKFRVTIVSYGEGSERAASPWSDWSRSIKLQAITGLPLLLASIKSEIDEQLKLAREAETAISQIRKILDTIKEGA